MEEIIKADIFFFITSISVIISTILLSIFSYYGIKILKKFSQLVDTVEEEVGELVEDFQGVRKDATEEVHEIISSIGNGRKHIEQHIVQTSWQEIFGALFISAAKIKRLTSKKK